MSLRPTSRAQSLTRFGVLAAITLVVLLPLLLLGDRENGWYRPAVFGLSVVLFVAIMWVSLAEMRRRHAAGG